jgi:glutamine synthetase adenylyltransferase
MKDAFLFYRGIESFLRLRGENILMRDEEKVRGAAEFMGFEDAAPFIDALEKKRKAVREFSEKYLTGR